MKCFNCGNEMEDDIKCPFCGYINKEETKGNIRIDKKDKKCEKDKPNNHIVSTILRILCYAQVVFSIMMALVCFSFKKPFFPFISWSIVALLFIPKIKERIISKFQKIKKWIIPVRIILIILSMIIFIANLSKIYENEWVSNNGISVKLDGNSADVVEDEVQYHGSLKTQYIDGVTNIDITTDKKNFKFYFKYDDDIVEFYYMKDDKKIYLVPKVKNSAYTYIEGEKEN